MEELTEQEKLVFNVEKAEKILEGYSEEECCEFAAKKVDLYRKNKKKHIEEDSIVQNLMYFMTQTEGMSLPEINKRANPQDLKITEGSFWLSRKFYNLPKGFLPFTYVHKFDGQNVEYYRLNKDLTVAALKSKGENIEDLSYLMVANEKHKADTMTFLSAKVKVDI